MNAPHRLIVCTSCRLPGEARDSKDARAGARLFEGLSARYRKWAAREQFVIEPYACLSVCPRPCGVALQSEGKYTYVFGDMSPAKTEEALIECATLYRRQRTGFMEREQRPLLLRASILARVPPFTDG